MKLIIAGSRTFTDYQLWTWPHDRGHMWEEISPHLSRDEVGLEPACYHAMLRLTLRRHSA